MIYTEENIQKVIENNEAHYVLRDCPNIPKEFIPSLVQGAIDNKDAYYVLKYCPHISEGVKKLLRDSLKA